MAEALESLRLVPAERENAAAWAVVFRSGDWSTAPPYIGASDVAVLHAAALLADLPHLARAFRPIGDPP